MGPPEPAHTSATGNSSLQERQSCLPMGGCTSLEGDGDPHQLILHKQLSGRYQCGNDICSISPDQQISYPLSADDGGAGHWTDGGFDVVEELETGTMDGCAGPAGGFVCVFAEIWHTDVSCLRFLGAAYRVLTMIPVHGSRRFYEHVRFRAMYEG